MSVPVPIDGEPPSKTTLYCPDCGHENPPNGDWQERECRTDDGLRRVLSCPVCGTDVISQPVLAIPA